MHDCGEARQEACSRYRGRWQYGKERQLAFDSPLTIVNLACKSSYVMSAV